jgi:16S rRNA (cytidine1402-2'-O)-methyltransferase
VSTPGSTGRLILVATPLGNMADISPRAVATLAEADVIACEDTRRTGRLLTLAGVSARRLVSLHGHNEASMVPSVIEQLRSGSTVAVVSDAGMPVISDPGERLVRAAVDAGIEVSVVPGPSAAVAGLVLSGLPADRWVFEGFVPRKGRERAERLAAVAAEERTVVLYEAPHRLTATIADLARVCGADRAVVVARELTKLHEEVWRGTLGEAVDALAAPRGEYVLVLGGAAAPEISDEEIASALDAGTDVAAVAIALRVSKNRVYAIALGQRAKSPRQPRNPTRSPPHGR